MHFRLLIFAAATVLRAQQPAAGTCSLAGQVLRADTGEPVHRAVVALRKLDSRSGTSLTAATGTDGRFQLQGIEPGQYRLSAGHNGFLPAEYGQRSYGKPGTPITLAPRQQLDDIVLRLVRDGAVSGRAVNEDGEKIAYVRVQTLKQAIVQGRKQWVSAGMATTNDLGEYRIFGLAPGRYILTAHYTSPFAQRVAAPTSRTGAPPSTGEDEGYAPLFYPGTPDAARATPIEVQPGADLRGIDFNLAPTRTVRVRGRVKFEGAETAPRPMVTLLPRNSQLLGYLGRHGTQVDEKGEFEIRGVTPGSYMLAADLFDQTNRQTARMPIEVGSSSIEGLNLVMGPAAVLQGRIRVDGDGPYPAGNIRVFLQSADGSAGMGTGYANVKPDGTFTIQNLSNDVYLPTLSGLPEDYYVQSIRLGDVDATEAPIDLSAGAVSRLEIVLGMGTAQVEGTVTKAQEPAAGGVIVLVPDGRRRGFARFYKTATADQNGHFLMKGITPGEYKAFAWDEVEEGIYQDAEFLQTFESKGKSVSLKRQARETTQLELLNVGEGQR